MTSQTKLTIIKPRISLPSLTTKFDAAIVIYARSKAESNHMVDPVKLARAAVAAYRMGYEDLYQWMKRNRYRWDSRRQSWVDLRERD